MIDPKFYTMEIFILLLILIVSLINTHFVFQGRKIKKKLEQMMLRNSKEINMTLRHLNNMKQREVVDLERFYEYLEQTNIKLREEINRQNHQNSNLEKHLTSLIENLYSSQAGEMKQRQNNSMKHMEGHYQIFEKRYKELIRQKKDNYTKFQEELEKIRSSHHEFLAAAFGRLNEYNNEIFNIGEQNSFSHLSQEQRLDAHKSQLDEILLLLRKD